MVATQNTQNSRPQPQGEQTTKNTFSHKNDTTRLTKTSLVKTSLVQTKNDYKQSNIKNKNDIKSKTKLYPSAKYILLWLFAFVVCLIGVSLIGTYQPNNNMPMNAPEGGYGESTDFAGGSGTSDAPYQIKTPQQLKLLSERTSLRSKCFVLIEDIIITTESWTPIGKSNSSTVYFTGTFDGGGYSITFNNTNGVNITGGEYAGGLFGFTRGATIKNLGVNWAYGLTATYGDSSNAEVYVGGIVGSASSITISNCYNTGSVTAISSRINADVYVGGIIGSGGGTISNCYNTGSVIASATSTSGSAYAGGISGRGAGNATFSDCYNKGKVVAESGSSAYAGGIWSGFYDNVTNKKEIINCYNTGDVSATCDFYAYVGGILGYANNYGSGTANINGCYNYGSITAKSGTDKLCYVGGIVGCADGYTSSGDDLTVGNCYNCGSILILKGASKGYAGGIVGYSSCYYDYDVVISNCYNIGSVIVELTSSSAYVGGILGYYASSKITTITKCYNTGSISATSSSSAYAGGISGYGGTIKSCFCVVGSTDDIKAIGSSAYVGGVSYSSTISGNCHNYSGESTVTFVVDGTTYNAKNNSPSGQYKSDLKDYVTDETEIATLSWASGYAWTFYSTDASSVWIIDTKYNNSFPILKDVFHLHVVYQDKPENPTQRIINSYSYEFLTNAENVITLESGDILSIIKPNKWTDGINRYLFGSTINATDLIEDLVLYVSLKQFTLTFDGSSTDSEVIVSIVEDGEIIGQLPVKGGVSYVVQVANGASVVLVFSAPYYAQLNFTSSENIDIINKRVHLQNLQNTTITYTISNRSDFNNSIVV